MKVTKKKHSDPINRPVQRKPTNSALVSDDAPASNHQQRLMNSPHLLQLKAYQDMANTSPLLQRSQQLQAQANAYAEKNQRTTTRMTPAGKGVIQGMFYAKEAGVDHLIWHYGPVVKSIWQKSMVDGEQQMHNGYGVWERKDNARTGEKMTYLDFLKKQKSSIISAFVVPALGYLIYNVLSSLPAVQAEEMIGSHIQKPTSSTDVSHMVNEGPMFVQTVFSNITLLGLVAAQYRRQPPMVQAELYHPLIDRLGADQFEAYFINSTANHEVERNTAGVKPTALPIEEATYGTVKKKENAGASGGGSVNDLELTPKGGKKKALGKAYLKNLHANANTDNSTAYATLHNEKHLRALGVETTESRIIRTGDQKVEIAAPEKKFLPLSKTKIGDLTKEQRTDYAKLSLLSPIADLHKDNVVIFNHNNKLGTHDADTSSPMLTHWHSRLTDRFALASSHTKTAPHESYESTEVGANYLGQGKTQDFFYNEEIQLKESEVVNAIKSFCDITPKQIAAQMKYFPAQGPASQKLALYSIQTQQKMLREAFSDFSISTSDTDRWEESPAHELLKQTIEKYEKENQFPYKFTVKGKNKLEVEENENFQGPKGTEKWKDKDKGRTNPELVQALKNGHIADANLRINNHTAITPSQIPKLMKWALPSVRSIGAGNLGVELIAKLILHPSFKKMGGVEKGNVKKLFGTKNNSTALRQAFYPPGKTKDGTFKSDNFHKGGKAIVRRAYDEVISKL